MSADQPAPPAPPPPPPADGPHPHYRMEIAVTRRGEATVTSAAVPGPAPPAFRDGDPNLAHITDGRWRALLRKFVDHQRRTGALPDPSADADQQELLAWYLRTVQEYAKNRGHKKSSLTKHHSRVLEEEAGFVFGNNSNNNTNNKGRSFAVAAEDEEEKETKTTQEAGKEKVEAQESDKKGKQGGASPRIRIKIPKVAAGGAAPDSGVVGGGIGSHTPKDSTPKEEHTPKDVSTPKVSDTPMDVDDDDDDDEQEASYPTAAEAAPDNPPPAFADDDNLPVDGVTLTPAQRRSLEQTPPDPSAVALLVRRFTSLLTQQGHQSDTDGGDATPAVALDEAAGLLGVPKHRLVDIVEMLEGIGLVERTEEGEEGEVGSAQWLGAEGMREQTGEESEGRSAKERKVEDAGALREEIGKLYQEER